MIGPHSSWDAFFSTETNKAYFKTLRSFVTQERKNKRIYPMREDVFNAFKCPVQSIHCIIIGQDPYHQPMQATGLAFSVQPSQTKVPPSLQNMFKEIKNSYPEANFETGSLSHWADQGILLLNRVLTVEDSNANAHANKGWETLTKSAILFLIEQNPKVVFLLWGRAARNLKYILPNKQLILEAPHPSPLSAHRGFMGCGHFKKCNVLLQQLGKNEIDWSTRLNA
ncbi:uracil-DNA glycosylase [Bacteroidia bacterium]|nr:uracil-DNA glycosylase [Bacteroidia bacterium]